MQAVVSKKIKVHDSRLPMIAGELRVAMRNIQWALKPTVQMKGKWSLEATACLIRMLGRPKRRSAASSSGAIAAEEPEDDAPHRNAIVDGTDNDGQEPEDQHDTNADNDHKEPENANCTNPARS